MNIKEIKELLKLISELDLREVRIKDKDFQIRIRTDKDSPAQIVNSSGVMAPAVQPAPIAAAPQPAPADATPGTDAPSEDVSTYVEIKSPMVGTFYRSSSPEKPPYIQVGDQIAKGEVVCIIEAMKLFNEIESEVSGKIVKVLIDDSTPVEYDQVLFLVDPGA